jgi:transcriptional regulator with XRE-family HTH domain
MQTIPEQIVNIRKAAGLSQAALAAILKLTPGALCNYEKGRRPIRATDFEKIKLLFPDKAGEKAA